jgi:hypothetical protein
LAMMAKILPRESQEPWLGGYILLDPKLHAM